MSFETERSLIEDQFATEWAAGAYSAVPVNYENVPFTQPSSKQAWVRITILPGEQSPASLGPTPTTRYRNAGLVVCTVFTPLDTGTKQSRQLCDEIGRIFRGVTIIESGQQIRLRAPAVTGGASENGWYQQTVTVGFIRDVHFT